METEAPGVDGGILAARLPGSISIMDALGSRRGSFSSSAGPTRGHSFSFASLTQMSSGEGISAAPANHEEQKRRERAKQQTTWLAGTRTAMAIRIPTAKPSSSSASSALRSSVGLTRGHSFDSFASLAWATLLTPP